MSLPVRGDQPKLAPKTADQLIALLGVYASHYASGTVLRCRWTRRQAREIAATMRYSRRNDIAEG
jgi:hypothetical protein